MTSNCIECGMGFKPQAVGTPREKKYCCKKCKMRANSRKHYNIKRLLPGFLEKRKEYFDKWLDKNRAHFNELCRERNRINRLNKFKEYKEDGLCRRCGAEIADKVFVSCLLCREKTKHWYAVKKQKSINSGSVKFSGD